MNGLLKFVEAFPKTSNWILTGPRGWAPRFGLGTKNVYDDEVFALLC